MDTLELATSLRSATSCLHKRLRKQMYTAQSLSITEIETMSYLFKNEGLLPSELAAFTKVKAQSMSQILNRMETNLLIERKPSEKDKRKILVYLTELGQKDILQTRYERDEWLATAIEKKLTGKEKEILSKAIVLLNKLVESK